MTALVDALEPRVRQGARCSAPTATCGSPRTRRRTRPTRARSSPAGPRTGWYVQVGAPGRAGRRRVLRRAGSPQLAAIRDAIADDRPAAELRADRWTSWRKPGWELGGEPLKTTPRGYDADHPRIDLLRMRALTLSRTYAPADWMGHGRGSRPSARTGGRCGRSSSGWPTTSVRARTRASPTGDRLGRLTRRQVLRDSAGVGSPSAPTGSPTGRSASPRAHRAADLRPVRARVHRRLAVRLLGVLGAGGSPWSGAATGVLLGSATPCTASASPPLLALAGRPSGWSARSSSSTSRRPWPWRTTTPDRGPVASASGRPASPSSSSGTWPPWSARSASPRSVTRGLGARRRGPGGVPRAALAAAHDRDAAPRRRGRCASSPWSSRRSSRQGIPVLAAGLVAVAAGLRQAASAQRPGSPEVAA